MLGRVLALWRYPVKSMAAEALQEVEVGWHGLAGDRRWAFVRGGLERSDFPWLTIRQNAAMLRHEPRFADPGRPDASALAASLGDGVRVIKQNRGVFDAMPLSLITTASIAAFSSLVGFGLEPQRFRPNLLIESDEPDDAWVGRVLRIGGMAMRVDQPDERCVVINVDPVSGERNPSVLKTLARERGTCLGIYGSTVTPGRVAVNDAVTLEA